MKEERKKALIGCFPPLPLKFEEAMKNTNKKGAENFVIFLTHGDELFVRCYHRYYNGEIAERQRYVFAADGCCRYGAEYNGSWAIRKEFREPVFCCKSYGYTFNNTYVVFNKEAIRKSCMKYSCIELYTGRLMMEYLKLYCKHKNLEYLMKSGYGNAVLEEVINGYWGSRISLSVRNANINWKSNNLLKMLRLNRSEFLALKGNEHLYDCYVYWRDSYPKYKPDELFMLAKAFGYEHGTAESFSSQTGLKPHRIAKYLVENGIRDIDYRDYLDQCMHLNYNLRDTAICMPRSFHNAHTRLSGIISYNHDKIMQNRFKENMPLRENLEFQYGGFIIRQPKSIDEITEEGAALNHCVGGYAERHALGKLHIMFIRKKDKPDVPYYTMEISCSGKIIQVRGFRNRDMTNGVSELIERYKQYLLKIFDKERKTA